MVRNYSVLIQLVWRLLLQQHISRLNPVLFFYIPKAWCSSLRVEHLLNKVLAPEYRQVNVEKLMALAQMCDHNPNLQVEEYIVLDVLLGHAVRLTQHQYHFTK